MSVRRLATRDFRMRFFFKKIELAVYAVFALRNAHVDREVSRGEPIANKLRLTLVILLYLLRFKGGEPPTSCLPRVSVCWLTFLCPLSTRLFAV